MAITIEDTLKQIEQHLDNGLSDADRAAVLSSDCKWLIKQLRLCVSFLADLEDKLNASSASKVVHISRWRKK